MILFLYGEDNYRSKQKLDAIKAKYIDASLGDTNLAVLDFEDKSINYDKFAREILALPFLAKSRLVIVKNILSKGKKEIQEKVLEFLPKVPESTHLIFFEPEVPDRRLALFKKLNRPKISEEFKPLEIYQLRKWIEKEIQSRGGAIESNAVDKLIEYVGDDLWRMSNEIQKVTSYKLQVTNEEVEMLVKPKIEGNIFGMIDALGHKNIKNAVKSLHDLLDGGENELYIFTMIVYQFRNLLIIKDYLENSNDKIQMSNQAQNSKLQIAKKSGLNPYVVQKTMLQVKNFTFPELKEIYHKIFDYDIKIKTGKIEPKTALDILVAELCES